MGHEFKNCRKWEEQMYWTHFQSIIFCQILSVGFDEQLVVPPKFSYYLKEKLPLNVTLKGPSGSRWDVGLTTNGDSFLFKKGWKEFVENHSLQKDDVLIFKYNGDSEFDVLIFDGRSSCEREASYFVRQCEHTGANRGCLDKRKMKESALEEVHDSSLYVDGNALSKKPRKGANANPVYNMRSRKDISYAMPEEDSSVYVEGNTLSKKPRKQANANPVYNMRSRKDISYAMPEEDSSDVESNRRVVPGEKLARAIQMADAAATIGSFIVVMRRSHISMGFFMTIPSEWVTSNLPRASKRVILRVKEDSYVNENKTWNMTFCYKARSGGLTDGWKNFAIENNLKESDVCLFELASGVNCLLIFDVSIFRVVEEVNPLTRVTSTSPRCGKH